MYQRLPDEFGRRVLGLADAEIDWRIARIRRDVLEQQAQSFERVGLQLGQIWIHGLPCWNIVARCLLVANWCWMKARSAARPAQSRRSSPCGARPPRW